ncbi:MAG TPA: hypothetical protein VNZ49_00080 [Bacteroidia bacterium]|jgi:hypothetical protein|nr:hypothetical protein [Bacteroidia bacterium]
MPFFSDKSKFFSLTVLFFGGITLLPAQTYYPDRSGVDSSSKHELTITPTVSYSELRFLEGPMDNSLCYNNSHFLTTSPGFGCSLNYMATENAYFGLSVDCQTVPFSSMYIRQSYFYNFVSNQYKLTIYPEIECSFNYFLTDEIDNMSVGAAISYQTIKCTSIDQQSFFPDAVQFGCVNVSIPLLYDFPNLNGRRLHFFVGTRATLTVWYENDTWSQGRNMSYEPIVTPGTVDRRFNNLQTNLLFHGGMRYPISPAIRTQLDFGFGFGTPYYAQLGVIFRLNKKKRK